LEGGKRESHYLLLERKLLISLIEKRGEGRSDRSLREEKKRSVALQSTGKPLTSSPLSFSKEKKKG